MGTTVDFIEYVCEQIKGDWSVRSNKMFGEYMVYINEKPMLLVCDNTVYVKQLDCVASIMQDAERATPYKGAKEHYILDVDNAKLCREVISILEPITPLPKPKKKKASSLPPQ